MKKGCLWAIGIFFLLAIIGKFAGSSEKSTSAEVDSVTVELTNKVSAE